MSGILEWTAIAAVPSLVFLGAWANGRGRVAAQAFVLVAVVLLLFGWLGGYCEINYHPCKDGLAWDAYAQTCTAP